MNCVGITKQIINKNVKSPIKGILVNALLTSRLAMKWSRQKLETSSENVPKNSLTLRSGKIQTKNLSNLFAGVPIADKIEQNLGQLLITGLWNFGLPYKIPVLEPLR